MELSRCSYTILGILNKRNSIDKIHGLTINEISIFEKVSKRNTIHKKVKELEEKGFVSEGVKVARAKSYYLTELGRSILPIMKGEDEGV